MAGHIDILEQEDSLREPFVGSMLLHAGMAAVIGLALYFQEKPFPLGSPDATGGGSTVITPVNAINMPSPPARQQPVANDTNSIIPERVEPPKPQRDDPDAIGIKKKKDEPKKKKESTALQEYLEAVKQARKQQPDPSNVGSTAGARATSAIFNQAPGAGGVGTPSGMLGEGFGAYEAYLRTCISRNWKTDDVEASVRAAPDVIVQFVIPREGGLRNPRIVQSGRNPRLDNSGLRAVEACNPFNPLPPGFPKASANIEIVFRLQR